MAPKPDIVMLTARQVADRLGVKVETVYAYVSRGLLDRVPAPDGRTSQFSSLDVERLARRGRRGPKAGSLNVVLSSSLTRIGDKQLAYRGLDVSRLALEVPFESVAEWLWLGETPPAAPQNAQEWTAWTAHQPALTAARRAQSGLPPGTPLADRLRIAVQLAGPLEPLHFDLEPHAVAQTGRQLIATLTDSLPVRSSGTETNLTLSGSPGLPQSIAERLWLRLSPRAASGAELAALNAACILCADHGLAPSTFAARVAASVRADPCQIVAVGLGTLSGPLHGAASADVHRLLAAVGQADRTVAVLGEFIRRERTIPGFGHPLYTGWDPRARTLLDAVAQANPPARGMEVIEAVLENLANRIENRPNLDFALGAMTWLYQMAEGAGETLVGLARSAGWIAHALEEYGESPGRLRPRAHYAGPEPTSNR